MHTHKHWNHANVLAIPTDITHTWLKQMDTYCANQAYPRVLVACKCDQEDLKVREENAPCHTARPVLTPETAYHAHFHMVSKH